MIARNFALQSRIEYANLGLGFLPSERKIMIRDELLGQLAALPPGADIVVDLGRTEEDIVAIEGLSYHDESNSITLKPHPNDLRDVFAACRPTAG